MPMSAGAAATAPTSWCSASTSGRVASERRSRWSPDRRAADEPWDRPPPCGGEQCPPGRGGIPQARRASALGRRPDERGKSSALERGEQAIRAVDLAQPAQLGDGRGTHQRQQIDEPERLSLGRSEREDRAP